MRSVSVALAIVLLASVLAVPPVSAATPTGTGTAVDTAFAAGRHVVDFRLRRDLAAKVVTRPDGTIVVGGTAGGALGNDPAFAQLTPTGDRDETFGSADGVVIHDLGGSIALFDFALTSDGKIVGLAGNTGTEQTFVFRLNLNGSLDTNSDADPSSHFGGDGVVELDLGNDTERWTTLAVQPDGRVLVAGGIKEEASTVEHTAIVRILADATSMDLSFDTDGLVVADIGAGIDFAVDIALSSAGDRIGVLSLAQNAQSEGRVGVLQLVTANGTPDTTFSGDGKVLTALGTTPLQGSDLAYQADDRIVVTASTQLPEPPAKRLVLVRYTTAGALDQAFSGDGLAPFDCPGFEASRSLFIRSNGRITALGQGADGICGVRVTSSGALDTTFDGDGRLVIADPSPNDLHDSVASTSGRIVTLGVTGPSLHQDLVVNRFLSSGAVDTTFAPAGTVQYIDFTNTATEDAANGVAVDARGRILLAGGADLTGEPVMRLLRLLASGYRDTTYGSGARAEPTFVDAWANDIATIGNRAVVVGCRGCNGDTPDFAAAMFTARGLPDTSFSGDGEVATTFGSGLSEIATAVAIQADGRIVVAGTVDGDVGLVRYNPSGSRDNTFDGDGRVRTDIENDSIDSVSDLVIQPNGRILVVGSRIVDEVRQIAVLRYRPTGLLDTSFSGDGKVIEGIDPVRPQTEGQAIALYPDGRIIVGGNGFGSSTIEQVVMVLETNGDLDTFYGGGDGVAVFNATPGDDLLAGIAPAANGKILFGGWTGAGTFMMGRSSAFGSYDSTYGSGGREHAAFAGIADARAMAVQPSDGRIILVGEAEGRDNTYDFAAARFDP